ncbi:DUF4258 domain-containing protein [Myroides marinus]|uniref:DUF4258 domain-containing protein n=1 Tax=Myroides marinus TaxID=703342 RepID=UPI0025781E2C|nr:DUF4258 domain-containing protein [Myroides marinus]MDM1368449.1 DUF4258 domain-containing protein [Myroides marinus]MDM1373243.1 DUF4258 domain-containing protein [Myroides marinus]MDM1374416.1 DUF4258 domain-containing protein [Myroides marinus]MDM1381383.1 DUF4258 domain-containing protein [Myroides marinus]MDM1391194.1 DUF4258 domain-containing protein [Myroides marinus]
MKFSQRLAYYLFGLLIGSMFLFYFFGEKKTEFCYLPNCRVLKDLRSKPVTFSKTVETKFQEGWVTNDDVHKSLKYGDVNFSESNIDFEKGKLYVIVGRNEKNENILIKVVNYTDKILLYDIEKMSK